MPNNKSDQVQDGHFCFLDFFGGLLTSASPSPSDSPSTGSSGTSFGALCLVMYSLRIAMLFSFIAASCSDRIPDSGLIANDSDPRTRFAFTLVPRHAVTAPGCPSIAVFCGQKKRTGKEGKNSVNWRLKRMK